MGSRSIKHEYLSALAFLHSEIQGRRITADFQGEGGGITVLVDSSLVISGLRPHLSGPAPRDANDHARRGLGQLLPRLPLDHIARIRSKKGEVPTINAMRMSEDIQAWHVASALISKVYEIARGGGNQRIYQFPSHHKETSHVLKIIEVKYNDQKRRTGADQAKHSIEAAQRVFRRQTVALAIHHFMTEGTDIEGVADIVMSRGEQAMMTWGGGTSTLEREHQALSELKAKGLAESFSVDQFLDGQIAVEKFDSRFIEVESHARAVMYRLFHDRLSSKKGERKSSGPAHEADLEALVDLASYNKRLLINEIKHRVVFATTDRNLVLSAYAITKRSIRNAVRAYCLMAVRHGDLETEQARELSGTLEAYFGLKHCEKFNKDGLRWFQNFAGHYVRHLWAVSEDALIELESNQQVEVGEEQAARILNPDMFNGLYAKAAFRIKVSRRAIEKLFATNSFLDTEALNGFDIFRTYVHWNHLIRGRVKTWRIKNLGFENLGEEDPLLQPIAEFFPKMVYFLLDEFSNRNRDRAMVNLSDNGAMDLISQLAKKRLRGRPVDLNFLTLTNTNTIFLHIADKAYYPKNLGEFPEEYNNINQDCFGSFKDRDEVFDDRQRSHLKLLVLATIFAAMEKWAAAKDHTRRAADIIKRSMNNNMELFGEIPTLNELSNMSGREAYYMNAICHRMLAEEEDDFKRAETSLDNALSALGLDLAHNEDLDKTFHLMRLANEKWSQAIARYYLIRSLPENQAAPDVSDFYNQLIDAFGFAWDIKLGEKGEKHHVSLTELLTFLEHKMKSARKGDDTRLTTDAIALNFVQLAMVRGFWRSKGVENLPVLEGFDLDDAAQKALRWLNVRARDSDYIESFLVKLYRVGLPTVDIRFEGDKFQTLGALGAALKFIEPPDEIKESRVDYDIWRINRLREFIGEAVE